MLRELPFQSLQFFITAPYPCSYLPQREARSLVAAPSEIIDTPLYGELINLGFRRSGFHTYRPHCPGCKACVPVRAVVDGFTPNRAQRRAWKRHETLRSRLLPLEFSEEHYALYHRYQSARHAGGGMDQDSPEQYRQFLLQSRVDSTLAEFRDPDGTLRMVSLLDRVPQGLSAVYTFYDPDEPRAAYGVYNVLWQIALARELGLPYVYLGYWIEACRKMAYKIAYQPLEGLAGNHWQPLPPPA